MRVGARVGKAGHARSSGGPRRLWQTAVNTAVSPHPVLEFTNRKLVRNRGQLLVLLLAAWLRLHVRAQLRRPRVKWKGREPTQVTRGGGGGGQRIELPRCEQSAQGRLCNALKIHGFMLRAVTSCSPPI